MMSRYLYMHIIFINVTYLKHCVAYMKVNYNNCHNWEI